MTSLSINTFPRISHGYYRREERQAVLAILLLHHSIVLSVSSTHYLYLHRGYTDSANLGAVVKASLVKLCDRFIQISDSLYATSLKTASMHIHVYMHVHVNCIPNFPIQG